MIVVCYIYLCNELCSDIVAICAWELLFSKVAEIKAIA